MTRIRIALAVGALVVVFQLFVPPIVGVADQGDFRRVIGRLGYGPEQRGMNMYFVVRKYVPDRENRVPEWEQFSSQYFFVWAALGLNRVVSKDGKLDIEMMGAVYALAFLGALARLLYVTRTMRRHVWLWAAMIFVLTDVAYVAYFNTFFAEPASLIFVLLLTAESIEMVRRGEPTRGSVVRWCFWATMFVLAKPVNAAVGVLLALFVLRFGRVGWVVWAGSGAVIAASAFMIATTPQEMRNANTYNLVFQSVIPESRNPAADLAALGLDWHLEDYSRTGAWSPATIYPELEARGDIGRVVTIPRVLRFYLARPTRMWRHIQASLPFAFLLRPSYGNFEYVAGEQMRLSRAFAVWSDFHERLLERGAKYLLFALLAPSIALAARWRTHKAWMEWYAFVGLAALGAFFTAIFGDAQDNVKHLFLFNLLTDLFLVWTAALALGVRARAK